MHKASTRKLINIMRMLARDLPFKDNVTNTAITEAADRLEELQIESDMHSMGFRKVRDNEEKSELVHKLSSDEIIDMQKHTPVFITNGCCEATHDSLPEVFAKLGLQHGEFDGEWYPLTKEESQYISDDEIVAAGTCVRTGYACLYQGKKWLYPIMLTEDNSAIPPKLQSAMADMGGEVHVDEEGFGLRIPFEWAMKWCPNYDAYKTSLQLILEEN